MPRRRELLRILMESPLYWLLDYDERVYLVKEIQDRESFIQALGQSAVCRGEISVAGMRNRFV